MHANSLCISYIYASCIPFCLRLYLSIQPKYMEIEIMLWLIVVLFFLIDLDLFGSHGIRTKENWPNSGPWTTTGIPIYSIFNIQSINQSINQIYLVGLIWWYDVRRLNTIERGDDNRVVYLLIFWFVRRIRQVFQYNGFERDYVMLFRIEL